MTAIIQLTQDKIAIIDNIDYNRVVCYKWNAAKRHNGIWYAGRHIGIDTIFMHNYILDIYDERRVDHIDHNGLNNCRDNLRICTIAENSRHSRPRIGGSSRFKGVYWAKRINKWIAQITVDYYCMHIGSFEDEIEAAEAYNEYATRLHGRFAVLNRVEKV